MVYLVVIFMVETVSVFFMEIPISFNGMVTMKNKFQAKQILFETKIFLATVACALDTANVFNRFQQNVLESHEKNTVYLQLSSNVTSMKQTDDILNILILLCSIILAVYFDNMTHSENISYML